MNKRPRCTTGSFHLEIICEDTPLLISPKGETFSPLEGVRGRHFPLWRGLGGG